MTSFSYGEKERFNVKEKGHMKLLKQIKNIWVIDNMYSWLIRHRKYMSRRKFKKDIKKYMSLNTDPCFAIKREKLYPCLKDISKDAGVIDGHYFFQDIYFARKLSEQRPLVHYDIGSRVDGFISHLLAQRAVGKIIMLDIRPLPVSVGGLEFIRTDATELKEIEDHSIESISSLHAIEHFGLGRYGDSIDPSAWKKALYAVQAKLHKGGIFYLGLPIGTEDCVCFNAHRIFSPNTIIKELDELKLISFAYIQDARVIEVPLKQLQEVCAKNIRDYDCGLFIFQKQE